MGHGPMLLHAIFVHARQIHVIGILDVADAQFHAQAAEESVPLPLIPAAHPGPREGALRDHCLVGAVLGQAQENALGLGEAVPAARVLP